MPIRFPTMHIADSVVNRILNVNDELDAAGKAAPVTPALQLPNAPTMPLGVDVQGVKIDEQTNSAAMDSPIAADESGGVAAPSPGSVIQGANLVDSIA